MSKRETKPRRFNFPSKIDEELLGFLKERVGKTGSLRTAIAHQIEEEGLFLRHLVVKLLPDDAEARIAVDEYTKAGTLILETEDAQRVVPDTPEVRLLKEDPKCFSLLTWWMNRGLEEFKTFSAPREEKQAVLIGRAAGAGRYRQLYQALRRRAL